MLLRGCVLALTAILAAHTSNCAVTAKSPSPLMSRTCPHRFKRAISRNISRQENSGQRLTKVSIAQSGEPRNCLRIPSVRGDGCDIRIALLLSVGLRTVQFRILSGNPGKRGE